MVQNAPYHQDEGDVMLEGDIWLWLIALAVLLWCIGWLVSTETAVVASGDAKLKKMAEEDDPRAKRLIRLTAEPIRFRLALETARLTLWLGVGVLLGAGLLPQAAKLLGAVMAPWVANVLAALILLFVVGFIGLVFVFLLPRKLAESKPERIALKRSRSIQAVCRLFSPMASVYAKTVNGLSQRLGLVEDEDDKQATQEEIRLLVDVGQEKGVIEESEKAMINNVFEFGDMVASEAMIHRTEIVAVPEDASLKEALDTAISNGCSRLPVFRGDLDTILGIIYVKDLLAYVGAALPKGLTLTKIMRKPYFVPETIKCSDLLTEFAGRHLQMAIVVDEYGGTAGLVTVEDLMESIVGTIRDEYDLEEEEEITVIDAEHFEVSGTLALDELEDLLDRDFPEGDYDTLGGLLLDELERIPQPGEQPELEISRIRFKILRTENLRIQRVLVTIPHEEDEKEQTNY